MLSAGQSGRTRRSICSAPFPTTDKRETITLASGFRIRIDLMRIRIRIFSNCGSGFRIRIPNPGPGSGSRVWWPKIERIYSWKFLFLFSWSKIAGFLSLLGLNKGRPSYRRSLQPSKENIQHFKTWKFCTFFYFLGNFCPPRSGSGSAIWMRIPIQQLKLMRIRIRNPAAPLLLLRTNAGFPYAVRWPIRTS